MLKYILKRLVLSLVIIWAVVSFSFFTIRLMPGNAYDFLQAQLESQHNMTQAEIQARLNAVYHVQPNKPMLEQYIDYVLGVAHGDFGTSIINPGATVASIIASSIVWTIMIVAIALLVSFVVGIAVGTVMAAFSGGVFGPVSTFVVSFLSAVPNYLVAILLIYFFADLHPIFPTGAAYSLDVTPGWNLAFIGSVIVHATLPIIAYVVTAFAGWALQMKGSVVSVLGSEYVRASRAWGLSGRRITQSYIGRNAMLPQVTSLALALGGMFGGSALVETFFQYPGIGFYLVNAINERDYPVMMGCFILITAAVVFANFVVDLLYPLVDPRIVSPAAGKKGDLETGKAEAKETMPGMAGAA